MRDDECRSPLERRILGYRAALYEKPLEPYFALLHAMSAYTKTVSSWSSYS